MSRLTLSFAVRDYDHVRDIVNGTVRPEGIEITPMLFDDVVPMFNRMMRYGDFDVSELSFGRYTSLVSQGKNDMVAIPVFPSRTGRTGCFYVPAAGAVERPEDLAGKRIGIPEWAQTATIFARGWLAEEIGVPLESCLWFQTGVDTPARPEQVALKLPEGIRLERVTDRSLSDMLLDGSLDCAITAFPPRPFRDGDQRVRRLVKDPATVEKAYYQKTGIYPIMHIVAIRGEIVEQHPWVAGNLFDAFVAAKDNALKRARSGFYPVPWSADAAREAASLMGDDLWPYGVAPNRPTIEAFLRFGHDQGAFHRKLEPEELFARQTVEAVRV